MVSDLERRRSSRKWTLAKWGMWIMTGVAAGFTAQGLVYGIPVDGVTWGVLFAGVTAILAAYGAANVAQKRVEALERTGGSDGRSS